MLLLHNKNGTEPHYLTIKSCKNWNKAMKADAIVLQNKSLKSYV